MIPVFRPSIRRKEMDAVLSCLVSDSIGNGPVSKLFIRELSAFLDTDSGVLLREYERAIDLSIEALELEEGSGIIVSPLSSVLFKRSIEAHGYRVLLCDVDPDSLTPDLTRVEELADGAAALVADAPFGFIPDLERLAEFGLQIIEDISTSIGGNTGNKQCGSYGDIVILRMEPHDPLNVGGGTAVIGARKKYSTRIKKIAEEWPAERLLPDMNSSLGVAQFKNQENFFLKRREIYSLYINAVRKGRHTTPIQKGEAEHVPSTFPVFVKGGVKDIQAYARKKGVATEQAFSDSIIAFSDADTDSCEGARQIHRRCVLFPLYPMLSKSEIETVSKVLSTLP